MSNATNDPLAGGSLALMAALSAVERMNDTAARRGPRVKNWVMQSVAEPTRTARRVLAAPSAERQTSGEV